MNKMSRSHFDSICTYVIIVSSIIEPVHGLTQEDVPAQFEKFLTKAFQINHTYKLHQLNIMRNSLEKSKKKTDEELLFTILPNLEDE